MTQDTERMIAEMYLDLKAAMTEIRALKAQLEGHPGIGDGWMRTGEAAIALKPEGVISEKHLRKLLSLGAFSESKGEIRNVSRGAEQARWEYYTPKCRKALQRYFKALQAS
jgi:hypothetical protein